MFVDSIEVTMIKCVRFFVLILVCLFAMTALIHAQPYSTVDLYGKKPPQYVNRTLVSEKSGETGFSSAKHFFQNMFTHYNYFFNANNKLNEIIERAKELHKDDYTQLLPFYNFSYSNTAKETVQIDSLMYKVTAGVLLHDLRNDWIDNMYMLMGRAFLLKNNFDSAGYVFQYVNYAWSPKDDGYDIPIGSNISNDKGIFSISTIEKTKRIQYLMTNPPSRNESFLWQVRTYLERDQVARADALIALLKSDILFPKRLAIPLHEMIAYSCYKSQQWDSSAYHLEKALDGADGPLERARWEFLIGQMLQRSKHNDSLAAVYYGKSIKTTTDPLMEIFARLNLVSLHSNNKGYTIQDNISEIYHLGRRDKFAAYRDVIYHVAGQLELQNNNKPAAIKALNRSLKYNTDNPVQKQKTFLLLADTYFDSREFKLSYNFYDSINSTESLTAEEKRRVEERKPALKIITNNLTVIATQDSLQRVANMTDAEQRSLIKKILRKLRKEQGAKEEETIDFGSDNPQDVVPTATTLFDNTKAGDFYFNNPTLVLQGGKEFKSRWGNRPNADNWQRQEAISKAPTQQATNKPKAAKPAAAAPVDPDAGPGDMNMAVGNDVDPVDVPAKPASNEDTTKLELTYEGLMRNLPLMPEQKQKSDSLLANALFTNGVVFQNDLRQFKPAIDSYEPFIARFPSHKKIEQANYNLIYCYEQLGLELRADSIAHYLKKKYPDGEFTANLLNEHRKDVVEDDTTQVYKKIYDQFLEAKYTEARTAKTAVDTKYGPSHWTPQLLLIESVYYIDQQDDFKAINKLETLISMKPDTNMVDKAHRMIEFLRLRGMRRADSLAAIVAAKRIADSLLHINYDSLRMIHLSDSLRKLFIADSILRAHKNDSLNKANYAETLRKQHLADSLKNAGLSDALRKQHIADSLRNASLADALRKKQLEDSLRKASLADALRKQHLADSLKNARLAEALRKQHLADSLRNASLADALRRKHIADSLSKQSLADALKRKAFVEDSLRKINMMDAASRKHLTDSLNKIKMYEAIRKARIADSLRRLNPNSSDTSFIWDPNAPHYANIQLDDVMKTFINTAASAFNKFNASSFKDDIEIAANKIDDRYSFVYFGPFMNAKAAIDYLDKIKPYVAKTIIPWLPKSVYRYSIISERNLLLLQDNKNVSGYNKFLNKVLPNKF